MMHALITVRTSSTRLPNKCFLKLGELSVLEFVVKRAISGGLSPIICTSTDSSDDVIEKFAQDKGFQVFRGSLENKIERWARCAAAFKLKSFIVVDADDPYFDAVECAASLNELTSSGLDALITSEQSDSGEASVGSSFSSSFMETLADRTYQLSSQNLDVIPWELLIESTDLVSRKSDKLKGWSGTPRFRLTLDYPEDYKLFAQLAENFGPESSRDLLEEFLLSSPETVKINAFRSSDFLGNKERQIAAEFGSE